MNIFSYYLVILSEKMSRTTLGFSFLLVICLLSCSCRAQNNALCPPSSCGNMHDITYPFRLRGDPKNCGDSDFELDCQNNHAILTLNSKRFYVQAIDYDNFTIRVVDPGLDNNNSCSLPVNSAILYDDVPSLVYTQILDYNVPVVFINCLTPVNISRYVDISFCSRNGSTSSSSAFNYVVVGNERISDLADSCGIDKQTRVSIRGPMRDYTSLPSIREGLAYGFELSWYRVFCAECERTYGYCSLEGNTVTCRHYCREDVPTSLLGFRCQFEWWGFLIVVWGGIALGGLVAIRFFIGFICLMILVVYKSRRRHLAADETIEEFLRGQNNLMPIKYGYSEIKRMTINFKDKLGEGGYGSVYKGKLRSGLLVAVKMMSESIASEQEFASEVGTIGRIHHVNIVQLIGFCVEGSKRALVYEFMPNGSLDKYIFPRQDFITLSFERMFEISLGVARGINYLHRGCDMRILHFDIKPHNILLDENFKPKITDFGLAQLYPINESFISMPAARGTMGYMAPELFYKNIGGVSHKADVYSYGMLLMEMASRRENINPFAEPVSQIYFPSWVYDQLSQGKDLEMGYISGDKKLVKKMIIVALWCIQMKPADRPSMDKVVEMLEGDAELAHNMPPKPFLAPREMAEDPGIYKDRTDFSVLSIE